MNRKDKINRHLAQSQSTYSKGRTTADIIWTHRWIIAKKQIQDITIYVTSINMASVFDIGSRQGVQHQ